MQDPLERSHTSPRFAVPHPGEAADWYEKHLGFRTAIFEDGAYAIVRRGKLSLHLWECADPAIGENTACYTIIDGVDELDTLHAEWLEASSYSDFAPGRIESEPTDRPGHGMREFYLWDPAGNVISCGANIKQKG
ncbi:VOC family protein [Henriciella marina]|uniref:VOC family protein n=1 Tax=Henriciella marina TaxID=453851 RepID=UPI0003656401|nr:VOC family protein [Henriciella marina]